MLARTSICYLQGLLLPTNTVTLASYEPLLFCPGKVIVNLLKEKTDSAKSRSQEQRRQQQQFFRKDKLYFLNPISTLLPPLSLQQPAFDALNARRLTTVDREITARCVAIMVHADPDLIQFMEFMVNRCDTSKGETVGQQLPEKQYAGRFNDDFVEACRGVLERYLARIVRHPVARYAEVVTFLSCEKPHHLGVAPAGPSFYANMFHPDFNFGAEEATETVNRFDVHTKAVDAGVQGLRNVFAQI
ncbi:hypothetical protein BGW80DRAFT_1459169 [Lactifluus volemus]|nr:hypothetical protein BGW80DRAFT_1459169 [Lactifluus volemus]